MKIDFFVFAMVCLSTAAIASFPEHGSTVVTEDFSTVLDLAEKWNLSGGSSSLNGFATMVGSLELRAAAPDDFVFECDITAPQSDAQDAMAGVKIGGARFGVPCDGATHRLKVARRVDVDKALYSSMIDDGDVVEIERVVSDRSVKAFSTVEFVRGVVPSFTVDNVRLSMMRKEGESPNLLINSSFEYDYDGFPYYVDGNSVPWTNMGFDFDKCFASYAVDRKVAHSGKQSLRIALNPIHNNGSARVRFRQGNSVPKDTTGLFSIWMKGDRFGPFVKFQSGRTVKYVQVSTEWQRFEFAYPGAGGVTLAVEVGNGVKKNADNVVVWLDDAQLEVLSGNVAEEALKNDQDKSFASPYAVSVRDALVFAEPKTAAPTGRYSIPMLPSGVKPSVDLDSWKAHATLVDKLYGNGKLCPRKTEVFLAMDMDNLYIGQRNYDDFLYLHPTNTFREEINFHGSEFMISSIGKGKFVQFGASARGRYFDCGIGEDKNWDGVWTREGREGPATNIVDMLIVFPLGNLAGAEMSSPITLSVGRSNYADPDVSKRGAFSFGKDEMSSAYRNYKYWPEFTIPQEILRHYSAGATAVRKRYLDGKVFGSIVLLNESGEPRDNVVVTLTQANADGSRPVFGRKECSFPLGESVVDMGECEDYPPRMNVRIEENGKIIFDRNFDTQLLNPVSILGRLSFYMEEKEAEFEVSYSSPITQNTRGVLSCGGVEVQTAIVAPRFRVKMPLDSIDFGTHVAEFTVFESDEVVGVGTCEVIKRPFKPGASQINRFSRSVQLNGKPIVPVSPFNETGTFGFGDTNEVAMLKRQGFRTSHVLAWYPDMPVRKGARSRPDCTPAWFDEYARHDMPIIFWHYSNGEIPNSPKQPTLDLEWVDNFVKYFEDGAASRGWTNIIAHVLFDEPDCSNLDQGLVEKAINIYRERFPYIPVMMNMTRLGVPSNYANLATDILMIDDYLTHNPASWKSRSIYSVLENYDIMWRAGSADGRPVWFFMVGGNMNNHGREPTYREQIAECYGALASGCTGISYFYGKIFTPGNWRAAKQVAREVGELESVLTSDELLLDQTRVNSDMEHVRCRTILHDGYLYLITCNIDEAPARNIRFTLPDLAQQNLAIDGEVEELFQKNPRKLRVTDGVFTDNFDGHSRHVYKVKVLPK